MHKKLMHPIKMVKKQRSYNNIELIIQETIHLSHITLYQFDLWIEYFIQCLLGNINSCYIIC